MATTTGFLDINGLTHFKEKQDTHNEATFLKKADAPTKLSQFTNDPDYQTADEVTASITAAVPTKTSQLTNDSTYQTATEVETAINAKIVNVYRYKGTVASVAQLPAEGNVSGDVYDVAGGMNYAWNGESWDQLGSTESAITNAQIDSLFTA